MNGDEKGFSSVIHPVISTGFERLQSGHLTKLLEEDLWADVSTLHVQKIISAVSELLERLKSCGEDGTGAKHMVTNCSL